MIERFVKRIRQYYPKNQEPSVIFDVGSRDALQSVEFSRYFPQANIYAFECNPQTLPQCYKNAAPFPNITVVNKAIHTTNGKCKFYPIDTQKSITSIEGGNPGASSLFKASGLYPAETFYQNEIEVESIRLDTFCQENAISGIDLLWLDLQGAEILALQSLGDFIFSIKMIHTEVEFKPIYEGQCLFWEVENYLSGKGFLRLSHIKPNTWFADIIYVNTRFLCPEKRLQAQIMRTVNQAYCHFKYYVLDPLERLLIPSSK
jgi:FkbM family methyltransferase